jgi:hypothetical protein
MEPNRERYRKLPGHRRGFIFGSSVWMGSDHLLLVKSSRVREEYKRFYFRDIQAIVMARTGRFHISPGVALVVVIWLLTLAAGHGAGFRWAHGLAGTSLVFAWWYVSATRSCRCRIYTAVSSDELPSLYRTWTARRFLARVEPLIAQAQGAVEGTWAEAVEDREIGAPAEGRIGLMTPPPASPMPMQPQQAVPPPPSVKPSARTARTSISLLFVGSLCLGGLAELLTMHAGVDIGDAILLSFLLVQTVTAVAVLVQNYQGVLRPGMRNLGIVFLAAIGLWFYVVQVAAGAAIGYQNAKSGNKAPIQAQQLEPLSQIGYPTARGFAGGIALLMGLAGAVLLLREDRPPEERISFNV